MTKEVWNIPSSSSSLSTSLKKSSAREGRRETEKERERAISVKVCQLMRRGKGQ